MILSGNWNIPALLLNPAKIWPRAHFARKSQLKANISDNALSDEQLNKAASKDLKAQFKELENDKSRIQEGCRRVFVSEADLIQELGAQAWDLWIPTPVITLQTKNGGKAADKPRNSASAASSTAQTSISTSSSSATANPNNRPLIPGAKKRKNSVGLVMWTMK